MIYMKNFNFEDFLKENYVISKNILTNLYINNEIEEYFNVERHLIKGTNNWIILVKLEDYYKMFYSFNTEIVSDEQLEIKEMFYKLSEDILISDIICEFVYKREQNPLIKDILEMLGFEAFINRVRMSRRQKVEYEIYDSNEHVVVPALIDQVDEIQELSSKVFDKYTSNLPSRNELEDTIRKKEILIIRNKNYNEFLGFIKYSINKNVATIDQLIVKEKARGLKIASKLVNYYLDKVVDANSYRANLWVKVGNKSARKLYENNGYIYENLYSNSYLRKGEFNGK